MIKEKLEQIKAVSLEALKNDKDNNIKNGILLYITIGTFCNPKYDFLTKNQKKGILKSLAMISVDFYNHIEELCKEGYPEKFDLYERCSNAVSDLIKMNHSKKNAEIITELLLTATAATFRMWHDGATNEDVIAYFEEREHKELPDMSDSSITFAWAMEQNIPCSDIRSLLECPSDDNSSTDEQSESNRVNEEMREMFDEFKPEIIEEGVPENFIDSHLEDCQNMLSFGYVFFYMIPSNVDEKQYFTDSKKMDKLYNDYLKNIAGPEMKKVVARVSNKTYYRIIFGKGMHIAYLESLYKPELRSCLYKSRTNKMAEKFKG